MPIDLGRRLIAAGVVSAEEVEAALFLCVVRGMPFPRALVDRGALSERALEEELGRRGGLALRQVAGVPELIARLPPAMCRRLGAVPVRHDAFTGTVDVAAADPLDPQVAAEFGFHLGAPIRVIRAPLTAVEEAIRRVELDDGSPASPQSRHRRSTPAFPHGAPASSIPPPNDEVPIPLVRRLGVPLIEDADTAFDFEARRRFEDDVTEEGEPVLSLRHSKVPSERMPSRRAPSPPPEPDRRALREPREEPPSVSFPSSPPGTNGADGDVDSQIETLPRPPARPSFTPRPRPITAPAPTPRPTGRPALDIDIPARRAAPAPNPRGERDVATYTPGRTLPAPPPLPQSGGAARGEATPEPPPLPFHDPGMVLGELRDASSRDEVVKLSLRGLRLVARRVAVFAVKRDGFHGWACNPEFGDVDALRSVVVPLDQPSILATATAASIYLGPIPGTPPHQALSRVMGRSSPDVAAVAVRASGRAAMLLLADDLGDTLTGTRRMDELARAAGDALSRLLAR